MLFKSLLHLKRRDTGAFEDTDDVFEDKQHHARTLFAVSLQRCTTMRPDQLKIK